MSIRRNTLYNLAGTVVPLGVALVTVPLYLELIGEVRFGVLAIAWVLLGYFGLFDLGLGRATAQKIAALQDGSPAERAEIFWTALVINGAFGLLGALFLWLVANIAFSAYVKMPEDLRAEAVAAVAWLAFAVPVATLSGVLSGALQGLERFKVLAVVNMVATVLFQVFPLLVACSLSTELTWLLPATLLTRLIPFFVLCYQCKKLLPLSSRPLFKRALVVPLFRYGGWVTITSIINPMLSIMDRVFIGVVMGASSVAHYVIPFNLVYRATVLPMSLSSALFPRFVNLEGSQKQQLKFIDQANLALVAVFTPIILFGLLLIEPFLIWWVSADFATKAADVGHVIAIAIWINALSHIPLTWLQAQGRPDLVAKCHIVELLPYVLLLWIFLDLWGVIGAAIAWALRAALDTLFLCILARALSSLIRIVLPAILVVCQGVVIMFLPMSSPERWIIGVFLLCSSLVLGWKIAPASLNLMPCFFSGFMRQVKQVEK